MIIKFSTKTSASTQYETLVGYNSIITACADIISILKAQVLDGVDPDVVLDRLEGSVSVKDFSKQMSGTYGSVVLSPQTIYWARIATSQFSDMYHEIYEHGAIMEQFSNERAEALIRIAEFISGAISYVILDSLGILGNMNTEALCETPDISEGVSAFIQDFYKGKTPHLKFINHLYSIFVSNPPIMRIPDQFPEEWEDFSNFLEDTEFGVEVLSYSDLLYICDVKAILMNKVEINEDLLQVLKARDNDDFNPRNLYPHKVAQFLNRIPDEFCDLMLNSEDRLSEDLIDSIVDDENAKVTAAFVKRVETAPKLTEIYKDEVAAITNARICLGSVNTADDLQETAQFAKEG